MVVHLMEDHELPLIDAVALIHGGSRELSPDKAGMGSIFAQAWRTGGSKSGRAMPSTTTSRRALPRWRPAPRDVVVGLGSPA